MNFVSRSKSNIENFNDALILVRNVARSYADTFEISPVVVFNIDEDAPRQRVNYPGSPASNFRIDCERITERILMDRPDLQQAWFRLAQDLAIPAPVEHELVRLLSKAYRPIEPVAYFRSTPRRGGVQTERAAA